MNEEFFYENLTYDCFFAENSMNWFILNLNFKGHTNRSELVVCLQEHYYLLIGISMKNRRLEGNVEFLMFIGILDLLVGQRNTCFMPNHFDLPAQSHAPKNAVLRGYEPPNLLVQFLAPTR